MSEEPPKTWKDVLRQSRMARYPLATFTILLGLFALLWWLEPDFVSFLGSFIRGEE